MVRDTLAEILQGAGHRALLAANGEDGLTMVQAVRPDLILLDYAMPGMNGLEVVNRLRADPETRGIPIVALTSATAIVANELSRAGCVGFIPKPFEPDELRRLIAEFLKATVGRARPTGP